MSKHILACSLLNLKVRFWPKSPNLGHFGSFWARFAQILEKGIYFQKMGYVSFLRLSSPNFMQNIRKNWLTVLRAFSQTLHFSSPLQWSSRVKKCVCVSPQMSYFPSIVFSDFLHGVGQSKMIKSSEARFSKKDLVFPKFWKKCQKVVKIEVFSIFLKNGSNDFPDFLCEVRSNSFFTFSRKLHVWQKSGSWDNWTNV